MEHAYRLALRPPRELASLVRYIHIEEHSGGPVTVPATPNAMLSFFLRGGTASPAGSSHRSGLPSLCGPLTTPRRIHWLPGTSFVTVHLAPEYLPLLFGIDAASVADAPVELDNTSLRLEAASLSDVLSDSPDPRHWAERICRWLHGLLVRRQRVEPFAIQPALLGCDTAYIARQYGLSPRQLERRYLAAYGQSIRDSRKMQRYTHALAALLQRQPGHGGLTRIAMDAGYHDQAHMIRDFVHFTAMPPKTFLQAVAGGDADLRLYRYDQACRDVVFASG